MSALSFSVPDSQRGQRLRILLSYNIGRISSYTLIGALAGGLGYQLAGAGGVSVLRVIAALLLIAMGLYLAGWWRGLTYLEKAGGVLWRRLQPLSKALMPVRNARSAVLLGAVWGWLPCGLVYTAVAYALAQADGLAAAGVMLAFGLGTLPAVLMGGLMAERTKALLARRDFRLTMALIIIAFGLWTLAAALQHAGHSQHGGQHDDHAQHSGSSADGAPVMDHSKMNHSAMDDSSMEPSTMDSAQPSKSEATDVDAHSHH